MPDPLTDARKVVEALERMTRKGGLGLDVHEWIDTALAAARRLVAALEKVEPVEPDHAR